jgi:hypothetical protein
VEVRAHGHREEEALADRAGEPLLELLLGDLPLLEVALHELQVGLGHRLDQLVPPLGDLSGQLSGHVPLGALAVAVALEADRLAPHQVDDALEPRLGTDGTWIGSTVAAEARLQGLYGALEVSPLAVHLGQVEVDREAHLPGGLPNLLGVDLDPRHRVDRARSTASAARMPARVSVKKMP